MQKIVIRHSLALKDKLMDFANEQSELLLKPFGSVLPNLDKFHPLLQEFSLGVILEIAFGDVDDTLFTPEFCQETAVAFDIIQGRFHSKFRTHNYYKTKTDISMERTLSKLSNYIDGVIIKYNNGDGDFDGTILESQLKTYAAEDDLSNPVLKADLLTVLVAGFETTSNSLRAIAYKLIEHPSVQQKVQSEVEGVVGLNPSIEEYFNHQSTEFHYIENVVKETNRLHPPLALLGLTSQKETVVNGHHFPKGSEFLLLLRAALLHGKRPTCEDLFFNPDRWDNMEKEEYQKLSDLVMPFGSGPRVCPGRALATSELVFGVAYSLSPFQMEKFPVLPSFMPCHESQSTTLRLANFHPLLRKR